MEYQGRLNELRSSFAMAEYHRLTTERTALEGEVHALGDAITHLTAEISTREVEEARITVRLDGLADQIAAADGDLVRAKSDEAAQKERLEAAHTRVDEQQAQLDRIRERSGNDTQRRERFQEELADAQAQAAELDAQAEGLNVQVEELAAQDAALSSELVRAQAVVEDEKSGIIDLLRRSAQMHNEVVRLNTQRESLLGEKGRLTRRGEEIRSELERHIAHRSSLEQRLAEIDQLIAQETERLAQRKAEAQRLEVLRSQLLEALADHKEKRTALQSRREVLADLERNMEGVGAGVRRLLDVCQGSEDGGGFASVAGLLADLLEVEVAHAPIIDAAVGDKDQCLVVRDSCQFVRELSVLGEVPGRLTAICLDRLPAVVPGRSFEGEDGFVARAVDLVHVPEVYDHLARHLLTKTIVVEDLATALSLAADDVQGHRFVTLSQEVVEADGRVTLGSAGLVSGLISRKSELRDIDARLADVEASIAESEEEVRRVTAELAHAQAVQQELRTAVYESNTARVEVGAAHRSTVESIERLTEEQPMIAREVESLEAQIGDVLNKSTEGGKSLEAMEQDNKAREDRVAGHERHVNQIKVNRGEVQDRLTEAKVAAGQLSTKQAAVFDRINALTRSIADIEASLVGVTGEIEQCQSRIAEAKASIEAGTQRLDLLAEAIVEAETLATSLRSQREEARQSLEQCGEAVKTARGRMSSVEEDRHQRQMSMAQIAVRLDDLVARICDELDVDLVDRYENYEHQEQDWAQVEEEIAELRAKMDRLGNVNLNAIDELAELEERHSFLTGQRDDLRDSHRQLEQLIDKLNNESLQRFGAVFEQIRDNFRSMFRRLFGGGRADIVLEDPDDMLESGIEIVAQPPGKDLQSMSLMSGGEKSMTAIALLMSVFKSRPAPVAILDEVDAALDEANNDRFNQIIHEFSKNVQFIAITHSKWTMNAADQLYGVTMQEPGVSTRVSVQLSGETNVA